MNKRPRRNRKSAAIRSLVSETHLLPQKLVLPLFLTDTKNDKIEISSLPGNFRLGLDPLFKTVEKALKLGINTFILFPAIAEEFKNPTGSFSYSKKNFYLHRITELKKRFPEATLISDVALDPYSSDGHDGIVRNGEILNDETLVQLGKMAVAQAQAGIDILGPSDMMDGRIAFIREALDEEHFTNVSIMSYTAKYASAMYGPFREALDSAPKAGDKKTYQMDFANRKEAVMEAFLDEDEGADFLMVKPALHYMDIISDLKANSSLPIAAYHVSGECAMLYAAAKNGWLNYEQAMPETLQCLHRAGADVILTYMAMDYAEWYKKNF